MSETQQAPAADINGIMTQAQVFASAWALIGSRFDQGDELANAEEQRSQLRTMLANAIPDSHASTRLAQMVQQLLGVAHELDKFQRLYEQATWQPGRMPGNELYGMQLMQIVNKARAAIAAEAAQPVGQCPNCLETKRPHSLDHEWKGRCECAAQPVAVPSEWREAAAAALRFIEGNAGHDQLCGVFDLDDEGRHKDCICGMDDAAKKLHAMLSAAQRPDDEPNATQWWLASLDKYGNPKLEDGAHSERAGANRALYLINSLNLGAGKKFAVVKVQLFDAEPDSKGANHEALATLSAAQIGGAA